MALAPIHLPQTFTFFRTQGHNTIGPPPAPCSASQAFIHKHKTFLCSALFLPAPCILPSCPSEWKLTSFCSNVLEVLPICEKLRSCLKADKTFPNLSTNGSAPGETHAGATGSGLLSFCTLWCQGQTEMRGLVWMQKWGASLAHLLAIINWEHL